MTVVLVVFRADHDGNRCDVKGIISYLKVSKRSFEMGSYFEIRSSQTNECSENVVYCIPVDCNDTSRIDYIPSFTPMLDTILMIQLTYVYLQHTLHSQFRFNKSLYK